ncbi:type II secretion system protein [bacterium]|nr:type II secretion system protein [bacterium]
MFKKRPKKIKAFTLLEVLFVIAVF